MGIIILSTLVSFFLAFVSIPVVIKIADYKKLFDHPGERKVHFTPVPSLGGIGIFAAVSFSVSIFVPFSLYPGFQYFLGAAIIIFFLGLKDDILLISPIKKFMGQLMAVFLLSYQGQFQLSSLHGFLGIHELHPTIATAFTYLTFLVIINAFNLIDGVDGLAGMLGLISTLFFGLVFTLENQTAYAILAFSTAGSLAAFLVYNISPARIFMGDTGSLLLGLVNAVLVIHFINFETSSSALIQFPAAPALGFAAIFLPLMDTLRVTLLRIYKGRSPFDPDVNHVHHVLLKRGLSHIRITGTLSVAAIGFILLAYVLLPLGITLVIFSIIALATAMISYATWSGKKRSTYTGAPQMPAGHNKKTNRFFTRVSVSDPEINN
jgi:UDP-N-acetylmuramyl pentapeptide phosphotransferase/UDP-N-acetylglucosamine-1-phosphate transferase